MLFSVVMPSSWHRPVNGTFCVIIYNLDVRDCTCTHDRPVASMNLDDRPLWLQKNLECRFGRGGGIGDTGRDPRGSPSPSTAPQTIGLSTAKLAASSQGARSVTVGVPAVAHCAAGWARAEAPPASPKRDANAGDLCESQARGSGQPR